jgi:hypothetical protein
MVEDGGELDPRDPGLASNSIPLITRRSSVRGRPADTSRWLLSFDPLGLVEIADTSSAVPGVRPSTRKVTRPAALSMTQDVVALGEPSTMTVTSPRPEPPRALPSQVMVSSTVPAPPGSAESMRNVGVQPTGLETAVLAGAPRCSRPSAVRMRALTS